MYNSLCMIAGLEHLCVGCCVFRELQRNAHAAGASTERSARTASSVSRDVGSERHLGSAVRAAAAAAVARARTRSRAMRRQRRARCRQRSSLACVPSTVCTRRRTMDTFSLSAFLSSWDVGSREAGDKGVGRGRRAACLLSPCVERAREFGVVRGEPDGGSGTPGRRRLRRRRRRPPPHRPVRHANAPRVPRAPQPPLQRHPPRLRLHEQRPRREEVAQARRGGRQRGAPRRRLLRRPERPTTGRRSGGGVFILRPLLKLPCAA
jgi:hypothetical protein